MDDDTASLTVGYDNTVGANVWAAVALGDSNSLANCGSGNCAAIGYDNIVNSWDATAIGNGNIIRRYGNNSEVAIGDGNVIGVTEDGHGSGGIAIGQSNTVDGWESLALGYYLNAGTDGSTAQNAFVLGHGVNNANRLSNYTSNSLAIGFNSTVPTLFVGPSGGVGTVGNVGIGSTAPRSKLDVIGTVTATAFIGDGSGLTGLPSGGGWSRTGTNVFVTTSTDNVGIGTSVPAEKLHIKTAASTDAKLIVQAGGEDVDAHLVLSTGYLGNDYRKTAIVAEGITSWSRADLHFVMNSAADTTSYTLGTDTRMIIKNTSGAVGIGTTDPGTRLHVVNVDGTAGVLFVDGDGDATDVPFKVRSNPSGGPAVTDADTRFIVTGPGNVGIGTTGPNSSFHIYRPTMLGALDPFNYVNLSNGLYTHGVTDILPTHVFGSMGSYNPSNGGLAITGIVTAAASAGVFIGGVNSVTPTGPVVMINATKKSGTGRTALTGVEPVLGIYTNATELMRVQGDGNVGIGSTVPQQKLDVIGTVKATVLNGDITFNNSFKLKQTSATEVTMYDSGDNVILVFDEAQ
jgi:hypothetical protein